MTVVGSNESVRQQTEDSVKKENPNMFDTPDKESVVVKDSLAEKVSALPGTPATPKDERVKINNEEYSPEDLVITPEEKSAFVDAMITGDRYRQTFTMFGGRVSVTLRSRTAEETHAFYAFIRHSLAQGDGRLSITEGDMSYVPLVAQVEELNGTRFPEMKSPLTYEANGETEVEPGWLNDFLAWKKKPEGLTSALINRLQLFEYKYWTMVKEASNKNFWNSDTSIEK